jgi:hypothetical protein
MVFYLCRTSFLMAVYDLGRDLFPYNAPRRAREGVVFVGEHGVAWTMQHWENC